MHQAVNWLPGNLLYQYLIPISFSRLGGVGTVNEVTGEESGSIGRVAAE